MNHKYHWIQLGKCYFQSNDDNGRHDPEHLFAFTQMKQEL